MSPGSANLRLVSRTCGLNLLRQGTNVQVQLHSVDFIRQSNGLEAADIGYGNANQRTPWWDASNPTMQRAAEVMNSYIRAMNTTPGAHVFVVGGVNSGSFSSFETAGIGWDQSGTTPGYALIAGKSTGTDTVGEAMNTLMHEVAHVLGMKHDRRGVDEISRLLTGTLPPVSCGPMTSAARRLLVPANTL